MRKRAAGSARDARGIPPFSQVVANREFRGLWMAEALSIAGDQLSRVALAVLVFDRTGSPFWTALVYAMTFLPALAGGLGLSQLADRFPRRTVLVVCALLQAAMVAMMTLPDAPLALLCVLVFLVAMLTGPTNAAQNATTREIFTDDAEYLRSQDLRGITTNTMMLLGLAVGGVLVASVGVRWALSIDAVTFFAAATIARVTVRWRPAAAGPDHGWFDGARLIFTDRKLRVLLMLALLVGFTVVPEGLAAPLAKQLDAPDEAIGWLLAAEPLGFVIGAFALSHYVTAVNRLRMIGPLAIASSAALVGFAFQPGLVPALALLAASGATGAYILTVIATVNTLVPNAVRGSVVGVGQASLRVVQGIGVALGGAIAAWAASATTAIAAFAVAGIVASALLARAWAKLSSVDPSDGYPSAIVPEERLTDA